MSHAKEAVTQRKRSVAAVMIPAAFIVAPAALFYDILFSHLTNLPDYWDDYDAVLQFLNQMVQERSAAGRALWLLAAQHNEYKLFFLHGLAWAQFALLGHTNFVQLCVLGDMSVLVLALLLWSMFLPEQKDLGKRLAFFVPVAWLLFQLGYWETLNWAMASLQNLWVIVFSFAAIHCFLRPSRGGYASALLLYVLAIASSGNGFLVFPVGLLIFTARRQLARAGGLLATTAVCIAAYAYHYDIHSSQAREHASVFATLLDLRPGYSLAFLGNAGALRGAAPSFVGFCIALGLGILMIFVLLARRGYARRNPAVACCVLFILLTALGIAGVRSDAGMRSSLTPRYTIYGGLSLIFVWTGLAEEFVQHRKETLLNNSPYLAVVFASVFFGLCMDEVGYRDLSQRNQKLAMGMASFERSPTSGSDDVPMPPLYGVKPPNQELRAILNESIRLGVYVPPKV
jgi:hypothetical protein